MSSRSIKARFVVALTLLGTAIILSLILLALQSNLDYDKAYAENLIRLHVVAHSNLPQDQDLKLLVRDEVLKEAEQILDEVMDKQGAYLLLMDNTERLEKKAQEAIIKQGFEYPVEVKMGQFLFPYREYASMTLPEGMYDAVRIEIGAARGDNWWCVLFPPLCLAELENADKHLVTIEQTDSASTKLIFRSKLWEHVAETRYAQALQKWWQASAAGLPALSN